MAEPYQVLVDAAARRALRQLPEHVQREIVAELRTVAEDPRTYPHVPLQFALSGSMKLRVDTYRAVYTVNHARRVIRVWKIGPRESVYRGHEPL